MADALYGGRAFRTLNLIDEGNRQVLGIEVAHSIPSLRVIRVMEQLIELHGKPRALRLDNGPELTSVAFTEWCTSCGIEARFIQPGKPDQNAFIERFNKTYRDEVLDAYVFESVEQVREVTETWLHEYNEERPHDSLGRVPPLMFMPRPQTTRESSFKTVSLTGKPTRPHAPHIVTIEQPVQLFRRQRDHFLLQQTASETSHRSQFS